MGYAKRNAKSQKAERNYAVWGGLLLLVALSVGVVCSYQGATVIAPGKVQDVGVNTGDENIEDLLHITNFLGYEFGKVYSSGVQMLNEPWFGFLTVYLDTDRPLSCLRFRKDTYEKITKGEVAELVTAFEDKYAIKLPLWGGYEASYRGKCTRVSISFSQNRKDDDKGVLRLEIEDVKLANDRKKQFELEQKQRQENDIERM